MERLTNIWLELVYGGISAQNASLKEEIVRLRERLDTQIERNQLLSALIGKDEEARRAASREIETKILDDMQRHPEKYVDRPDRG